MKLYYSPTSPFARVVRVALDHHGLTGAVSLSAVNPFEDRSILQGVNPLGKVPALQMADGDVLFDSAVICQYIDEMGSAAPLFPADGRKWAVRRAVALAQGVLDAGVAWRLEGLREEEAQSPTWLARYRENVEAGMRELGHDIERLGPEITAAHLYAVATGDWLSFRHEDVDWKGLAPAVAVLAKDELEKNVWQETDPRGKA